MSRLFETKEITKLLDALIGKVEAVGETNEDERRLDNLKTLIDVTNWCLDGLQFAMASGRGKAEHSMAEIDEAPSIDLVRCGECRYVGADATCCLVCDREGMGLRPFHVYPDDYCSYGQRKGTNNE